MCIECRLLKQGGGTFLVKYAGLLCVYVADRGLLKQPIQGQLVVVARIVWYLYFGILHLSVPTGQTLADIVTYLHRQVLLTYLCGLVKLLLQEKYILKVRLHAELVCRCASQEV